MKKLNLIVYLSIASLSAIAQNSFPEPTGNAEIKSGHLLIETDSWRSSLLTLSDTHYSPFQTYHFQIESDGLKIKQDGNVNFNFRSGGNFLVRNGRLGIRAYNPKTFLDVYTTDSNTAHGIVLSQGSNSDNRSSGRLFFENTGEISNSFAIMKSGDKLSFRSNAMAGNTSGTECLSIGSAGSVGIGTSATGTHKLAVEGSIGAREINVEASGWSDFVFEKGYKLRSLEEVEEHIEEKGHLPDIPHETEVVENGINLGAMNAKLLQKIEELMLYLIDVNKRLEEQEKRNKEQGERIKVQDERLKGLQEKQGRME